MLLREVYPVAILGVVTHTNTTFMKNYFCLQDIFWKFLGLELTQQEAVSALPPKIHTGKLCAWTSSEHQPKDVGAPSSQIGDVLASQILEETLIRNLQYVQSCQHEEEFRLLS